MVAFTKAIVPIWPPLFDGLVRQRQVLGSRSSRSLDVGAAEVVRSGFGGQVRQTLTVLSWLSAGCSDPGSVVPPATESGGTSDGPPATPTVEFDPALPTAEVGFLANRNATDETYRFLLSASFFQGDSGVLAWEGSLDACTFVEHAPVNTSSGLPTTSGSYPSVQLKSAGGVTVTLDDEPVIDSADAVLGHLNGALSSWEPGAVVSFSATAGDDFPAFDAPDFFTLPGLFEREVEVGEDGSWIYEWNPGEGDAGYLFIRIIGSIGQVECYAVDDGAFTVPHTDVDRIGEFWVEGLRRVQFDFLVLADANILGSVVNAISFD